MTEKAKQVIRYRAGTQIVRQLGEAAFLRTVGQSQTVVTKPVLRYDPASGAIETETTMYLPFVTELKE